MSSERIPEADGSMINSEYKPWENTEKRREKGLNIARHFSTPGVHPFDEIEWEKRPAKITDETGKTVFEQKDAEVPENWSQLATKVVVSKYFYGDINSGQRENSVKQLVHRVCRAIADRGGVMGVIFSRGFLGGSDVDAVIKHIRHIVDVGGEAAAALGSDFDGFVVPVRGLRDITGLPALREALSRAGLPARVVDGVMGDNALRMLEAARG